MGCRRDLRLKDEVSRLASRRVDPVLPASSQKLSAARDFDNPLVSRRLLRLSDVESLVGLSRSMTYRLISERRIPAQTRVGPTAVRWRAAAILAWQDPRHGLRVQTSNRATVISGTVATCFACQIPRSPASRVTGLLLIPRRI
jgi:predicted DNA-binding transcriptional regulator AlpA